MNKNTIKVAKKQKELQYDAKQLIHIFNAYKLARKNDCIIKTDAVKAGANAGQIIDIQVSKPLTITSFCNFADIPIHVFYKHIDVDLKSGLSEKSLLHKAFAYIRNEIIDEQISGAMLGIYNERIVGKVAGLNLQEETTKEQPRELVTININKKTLSLQIGDKKKELSE